MALARAAERWVSEFRMQDLANVAWAFATVNRPDGIQTVNVHNVHYAGE